MLVKETMIIRIINSLRSFKPRTLLRRGRSSRDVLLTCYLGDATGWRWISTLMSIHFLRDCVRPWINHPSLRRVGGATEETKQPRSRESPTQIINCNHWWYNRSRWDGIGIGFFLPSCYQRAFFWLTTHNRTFRAWERIFLETLPRKKRIVGGGLTEPPGVP